MVTVHDDCTHEVEPILLGSWIAWRLHDIVARIKGGRRAREKADRAAAQGEDEGEGEGEGEGEEEERELLPPVLEGSPWRFGRRSKNEIAVRRAHGRSHMPEVRMLPSTEQEMRDVDISSASAGSGLTTSVSEGHHPSLFDILDEVESEELVLRTEEDRQRHAREVSSLLVCSKSTPNLGATPSPLSCSGCS